MKRRKIKQIKYEYAYDIKEKVIEIINALNFCHIKPEFIGCIRSYNSRSDAIARCHALGKPFQTAFQLSPRYVIEIISERFDKLPESEQIKVLIHELLHIPKSFGGGFRHHDFVTDKHVNKLFKKYKEGIKRDLHLGYSSAEEKDI